ncbi:MAG: exodeoxyribonuclease VII small subunit [Clostridia bacterium]|nr:exodeoxyribonuclease VII small subunit [Clostridia bacterium]
MEEKTYGAALQELEEIVTKLEQGSIPLEESMALFTKANELALYCKSCLEKAEATIVQLNQDGTEADFLE